MTLRVAASRGGENQTCCFQKPKGSLDMKLATAVGAASAIDVFRTAPSLPSPSNRPTRAEHQKRLMTYALARRSFFPASVQPVLWPTGNNLICTDEHFFFSKWLHVPSVIQNRTWCSTCS